MRFISSFGSRLRGAIGILGGSFNPAHQGHLHISEIAIKRLKLRAVWWLVSPQNPLKSPLEFPLKERVSRAEKIAQNNPKIVVTNLESAWNTRFTIDTITRFKQRFPCLSPVFIIGADNLEQLPQWRKWQEIIRKIPLLVVARHKISLKSSKASCRIAKSRLKKPYDLLQSPLPAWSYLTLSLDSTSSTEIRAKRAPRKKADPAIVTEDGTPPAVVRKREPRKKAAKVAPDFDLTQFIIQILDDAKAENIVNIDLRGKSSMADNMIIAEGRSQRHVSATAQILVAKLKENRLKAKAEGLTQGDWVLIDAADTIVHLFCPETRAFYNLERLWQNPAPAPVQV